VLIVSTKGAKKNSEDGVQIDNIKYMTNHQYFLLNTWTNENVLLMKTDFNFNI